MKELMFIVHGWMLQKNKIMKKNQKTINLEQTKMIIMNNKNKIKKIIVAQMKKDLE